MANNKKLTYEQVSYWLKEITSCEERKKKELLARNNYPRLIEYYEGNQFLENESKTLRKMVKNDYFPNTNSLIAEIMYQNPDVIATATRPEAEGESGRDERIMKSALSYAFNKLDALTENRIALFDMFYAGFCAVEVNHKAERVSKESPDRETEKETQKEQGFFSKAIDTVKEKIGLSAQKTEEKELSTLATDEENYSLDEETYLRRWNPLNVGFDYRAERIRDIKYVYKIIRKTPAEFNAQYPDYTNKVHSSQDIDYTKHTDINHKSLITYYEIQVKRKGNKFETFVIAPSFQKEEIDYFERQFTSNDFDLKIGVLDEYGKLYPISRSQINKSTQDDTNNYLTHMMEVAERNIPKRGYDKNKVKDDGIIALNSKFVNDNVPVDGGADSIWPIPATEVSKTNKEMLGILQQNKEQLWGVSAPRLSQRTDAEFMGELEIQEAGYQEKRLDIQEGLRKLIRAELNGLKDIIVALWDGEYFFKITGGAKPEWYTPQIDPISGIVLNPLNKVLRADYELDVDISSALRPNKEQRKVEFIKYLTWLFSAPVAAYLTAQNKTINFDALKKSASEMGLNPESLFMDLQPSMGGISGTGLSMPEVPVGGAPVLPANVVS